MFGTMAFVLTAAVADPDLVTLRYETSLTAWSMCIDRQLEKIGGPLVGADVPRTGRVSIAMDQCHVFAQDFKRTLPDSVAKYLKDQGVEHYAPSVVDMLADGMFDEVETNMRREKEAQEASMHNEK